MASFQQVIIVGNVGRDIEMRFTPGGDAVANFSVAVNKNFQKDGEWQSETSWFTCTLWGEAAERHADSDNYAFIGKGRSIMVIGEMQAPRVFQRKSGDWDSNLEMRARTIRLLDKTEGEGTNAETRWEKPADLPGAAGPAAPAVGPDTAPGEFDDLPF